MNINTGSVENNKNTSDLNNRNELDIKHASFLDIILVFTEFGTKLHEQLAKAVVTGTTAFGARACAPFVLVVSVLNNNCLVTGI